MPERVLPMPLAERVVWLAILDYLLVSYHFAAQHFGLLSLYRARAGRASDAAERRLDRWFALVVGGGLVVLANALAGSIAFQDRWIPNCALPGLINGDTAFGNCVTSRHFQGFKVSQKRRMDRSLTLLPQIGADFERQFGRPGLAYFDATGIGNVVRDLLTVPARGVILAGREWQGALTQYVVGVEDGGIRAPRIEHASGEHRYASVDDVFGSGISRLGFRRTRLDDQQGDIVLQLPCSAEFFQRVQDLLLDGFGALAVMVP